MNEGFFTTATLKTFDKSKPLPPVLSVEFPIVKDKVKAKPELTSKIPQLAMDLECYINYFLVKFKDIKSDEFFEFEQTAELPLEKGRIQNLLSNCEIITFNGTKFDLPLLNYALSGATCKELKQATNELIKTDIAPWQFEKKHNLPKLKIKQHIDLIEVAPSILSLKGYGGRLGCKVMQDLPYPEDSRLTDSQMDDVNTYCDFDLDNTQLLYFELFEQIELRRVMSKKYKVDLLSKSDAQIAEAVIGAELTAITKKEYEKVHVTKGSFHYVPPPFIKFTTPKLNEVLEIVTAQPFVLSAGGKPLMPTDLTKLKLKIGTSSYKMGMGGLHSKEKSIFHVANDKFSLWDWDVNSFYPEIMLVCNLYPKQLGPPFMDVFENIVDERLEAKAAKDKVKADVLKIVVNGTFGKMGSQHSIMTSPDLMIQVTVTGQLSLLMLIEMMELKGFSILSGNTDGIVIKCPTGKEDMMKFIIKRWEGITGFTMESNQYAGLYSRDVNNYIAITTSGEAKTKGCFASAGIKISPSNDIVKTAMIRYIKYGTPFAQTIKSCYDVTKFLTVTTVAGGAVKDGAYLGKAIRFYHAKNEKTAINYLSNGDQVSMTEGCKPLMNITGEFPKDMDYDWYINRCSDIFYPKK